MEESKENFNEVIKDNEEENNLIENDDFQKNDSIKNFSLEELLKNPSCHISKEKQYLWTNTLFSQEIFEILTSKDENIIEINAKIYEQIENILMGDFCDASEKTIFYKDFYFVSFLLNSNKDSSTYYISFVIYYSNIDNPEYFKEYLKFLNISETKANLKYSYINFTNEHKYSNSILEYDKLGLLDSNIFFFEIKKNNEGKMIRYPIESEIINKSEKVKSVEMLDKKYEDKGFIDIDKYLPKSVIITNVLNIIRNKETLDYDLLFNKEVINFIPSKTEKKLINNNTNFILSGRPGTGKTFIILIKTVLTYLNCWLEHSKKELGLIDWEHLQKKYFDNRNNEQSDNYKIVVTSLSQILCLKAEELFSQCMRNLEYHKEYKPTTFEQIGKLNNFQDVRKFPLFVNFRKIIFLIDGSLNFQFFDRPAKNKMNKRDNDCDIKYIPNIEYDINYKVNLDDIGILNYFYRSRYGQTYKAKEINEDIFYHYFDEEIRKNKILNNRTKKLAITTYEVYSQIISIIKGSYSSYLSYSNSITREQYKVLGKKITMFTEEQKDEIYNYYIKYEKWKNENNYFDFQDVVNYLIRQVSIELVPKNIKLIDILFIDEVQDFSINQLYLMSLISRDIKVLAGDTCQTISKTNAFRFCDLNSIYYVANQINKTIKNKNAVDIKVPEEIQTNLNFRCHYPVLKLAHIIYEMIFLLFPQTLDKVKCDYTKDISGYQPSIIYNLDSFVNRLTGGDPDTNDKNGKNDKNKQKKEFTFAFNHCFICRNLEAENNLSEKYNKKILTSTITESKGMEYEIVIIYNFFKDAYPFVLNLWSKVLTHMTFQKSINQNIESIRKELEFEEVEKKLQDEVCKNFEEKISPTYTDVLDDELRHKLFNMCSELKELYVAITRSKTSLFFYDEDQTVYPLFIKILRNFKIINKEEDQDIAIQYAIDYLSEHLLDEKELRFIAEDNFKIGNYKKAEFYFNILKDEKMSKKSLIFLKFEEIVRMKNIDKKSEQFKALNKDLLDLINKYKVPMEDSDIIGDIYINLEMNDEALKFFKEKKNNKKCGLIYQSIGKYKEAFNLFDKLKEYGLAIECLISDKDYIKLFKYIFSNQHIFNIEHFIDYFKKYSNYYIENFKINFYQNNFTFSKNSKSNDTIYIRKDVKINKFESIFDDKNLTKEQNNSLPLFPKMRNYLNDQEYYGLNKFKEKHVFDQPSKEKIVEYLVSNNTTINIFIKTKFNNISKNEDEIMKVFDNYERLFKFIFDFLSFGKNNLEESIVNYINEQKEDIKRLKDIKYKFQNLENREEKKKNRDKLNSLLITKISNKELIYKVIKDWKLSKLSLDIIDTQLLKTNIVPYFIKNFPLLIMYKTNDLDSLKNVKSNIKELLNETLREIVKICKQLPLKDEELIKCLESSMILSGHFKPILPFLSTKNLFLFSAIFKKNKIFIKLLIEENISFIPSELKKGPFVNDDNFFFIFNAFLSLNICKYFNYRAKSQMDRYNRKNDNAINKIIVERIEYLKEYPKLYSLLYKFESSFQRLDKLINPLKMLIVPFPIHQYIGVFAKFLANKNEYQDKEIINLIEIGNTISLYITINGLTSTHCSKEDIHNYSENMYKIARFLLKLKELLLVYRPNNYKYLITIFSLFSAMGITLMPETKELKIYNKFPCGILNNSSILIWSCEKYFNFLTIMYRMSLFDSTSKNRIIFYNTIFGIFNEITHRAITKIFNNQNPFYNMPPYNFLDTSNIKIYFDSLLYNYTFHRRKYLDEICSLYNENQEEKLIAQLNKIINSPKAGNVIYNFGLYEDFCLTLGNWPGDDANFQTLDTIFCPFYSWEKRIKDNAILNFTQITLILGELPMPYETLLSLKNDDYSKSMSLIFDINENLFNDLFYLYNKVDEFGTIDASKKKNFRKTHGKKEVQRIFVNYILFSLLINKYTGYNYQEFYDSPNKKFIEELFELIKYNKDNFEKAQNIFPYKLILNIFKKNESEITKLLKLIWIKKLYPLVLYSLKKMNCFKNNEEDNIFIYGINDETIDFRYFAHNQIELTNEEISLYFTILNNFINQELFVGKAENIYNENILQKSNKYFRKSHAYQKFNYRGYLLNYIELQIYIIMLSLIKIKPNLKDINFIDTIKTIIEDYYNHSFYIKNICKYKIISENTFFLYSFNEAYELITNYIKIIKLTIREINVNSKYETKKTNLKNVMNKNFLNKKFLFVNNYKDEEDGEKIKYMNELMNFLFVPLQKETLPQYLQTAQKIYNDFWS